MKIRTDETEIQFQFDPNNLFDLILTFIVIVTALLCGVQL